MRKHVIYFALLFILPCAALAQQNTAVPPAATLANAIDSFAVRMPVEKVYLHIDKPYYSNTDTIWLKAYVLNANLEGSKQSGLLYTELVNDTGKVVLRQVMPVLLGLSWGQLPLDSLLVPEGSYTLRAYTNWMQNLGESSFFTRRLYISKTDENAWLVKAAIKTAETAGTAEMALQLLGQDGDPVRLQAVQFKLTDGNHTLLRDKMQTDIDGKLSFNMNIPLKANAGRLRLIAEAADKNSKGKRLVIPVTVNQAADTDVQFMPEGGQPVAGLNGRVAFKALNGNGRGTDISGILLDSKGLEAAAFKSTHKGMGSFLFMPTAGETYTAKITIGSISKTYAIPVVKPSGLTLTVNNIPGRDSILVAIQATADMMQPGNSYSLIAHNTGNVCYASPLNFEGRNIVNGRIAKARFPSGITRFTLFDGNNRPIAERIIFINHHDQLNLALTPAKAIYTSNDSVTLSVKATDKDNRPVQGSFSVAVTDDSQVKADSSNAADITAYMLLQSELKGDIEDPGYYFTHPTPETEMHLDNLLLTQGWVSYNWNTVLAPTQQPEYRAERDIEVTGVVTRLNKPQAGIHVNLLSASPWLMRDTVTDSNGRFRFNDFPRIDTASFMIQAKDKKGKIFEAAVEVDEFSPAGTKNLPIANLSPWYVNSDSTLLNYNRRNIALQKETDKIKYPGGIRLNEVVIKAKKIVKGSKNLNGPGNADQVMEEKELIALGKMSLYDLLLKKIKGFNIRTEYILNPKTLRKEVMRSFYALNEKQLRFIVDGVDLDFYVQPEDILNETSYLNFVRRTIELFTAEDIRGIEVQYSENYTGTYRNNYGLTFTEPDDAIPHATPCYKCLPPRYTQSAYIEITTWSGGSMFTRRKKGTYLYRPLPISWPKAFYTPKYTAKNNTLTELRSTIFWEPGLLTDPSGKASFTFRAKNKPGAYSIILQGSDVNGAVGSTRKRFVIKAP